MAATAVMTLMAGAQMVDANQKRQRAKGEAGKLRKDIEAQTKALSAAADAAKVGAAGSTAASKRKRQLSGAGKTGYSGTLLTGPQGVKDTTPAAGTRGTSTLLGL